MFSLSLNQVELTLFTLYTTTKLLLQSVVYVKKWLNKLNLTFLFSILRTLIPKCSLRTHALNSRTMYLIISLCVVKKAWEMSVVSWQWPYLMQLQLFGFLE